MSAAVLLSVVIPVLNGEEHLSQQLEALAEQELAETWEVVVVDNGSEDASVALATSFETRLPGLRVVTEPRRGKANALNTGVRLTQGELIVFLDQDDEVSGDYLEAMVRGLRDYDMVGGRLDHETLNPNWARLSTGQTDALPVGSFLSFTSGAAMGARRQVFDAVGGFRDLFTADDADFCWRVQRSGATLGFVPDAVLHYRHRASLRQVFMRGLGYGRGEVALYKEHRPFGCPRRDRRSVIQTVKSLVVLALASPRNKTARFVFAHRLGQQVGRLHGAAHFRLLYL